MHELTRLRAYARLTVAIVSDPYLPSDARSHAIDALVSSLVSTDPADHTCHAAAFPMVFCEGCVAA